MILNLQWEKVLTTKTNTRNKSCITPPFKIIIHLSAGHVNDCGETAANELFPLS